jgi:hypothetical protein
LPLFALKHVNCYYILFLQLPTEQRDANDEIIHRGSSARDYVGLFQGRRLQMPANFGDEPDDDEVSAQLEAVQAEIDGLDLENQIFEHFLQQNATLVSQLTAEKPNAKAKGKGKAADASAGKLTAAQKSEIGTAHLDTKKKEMEDSRKASEKLVDTLRAVRSVSRPSVGTTAIRPRKNRQPWALRSWRPRLPLYSIKRGWAQAVRVFPWPWYFQNFPSRRARSLASAHVRPSAGCPLNRCWKRPRRASRS